jgi:hypothetical protein
MARMTLRRRRTRTGTRATMRVARTTRSMVVARVETARLAMATMAMAMTAMAAAVAMARAAVVKATAAALVAGHHQHRLGSLP